MLNVKILNFSFQSDSELVVESFSEDEDGDKTVDKESKREPDLSVSNKELDPSTVVAPVEIQNLLHRKEELEKRHRRQERHRQRVQVGQSSIVFLFWELPLATQFMLQVEPDCSTSKYKSIVCWNQKETSAACCSVICHY